MFVIYCRDEDGNNYVDWFGEVLSTTNNPSYAMRLNTKGYAEYLCRQINLEFPVEDVAFDRTPYRVKEVSGRGHFERRRG